MSTSKVFYSWQSDSPPATNRNFILKALEDAAEAIRKDDTIEVEPVVDRDTAGVPGAPDIANTILDKIEQAQVFVCDVTIINPGAAGRLTPNPNVLIELGYAIKKLGFPRIIMVMNKAFGEPEDLPFDLRMRRVVAYRMEEETAERAPERRRLQSTLEAGLRGILDGASTESVGTVVHPPSLAEQAGRAVEEEKGNRVALATRYMRNLTGEINALAPDFSKADQQTLDDPLVQAVAQTDELVVGFAGLCESVAIMNDAAVARAIYQGFGPLLEGYDLPLSFTGGSYLRIQFDFHKFMGQELFLVFMGKLIAHERWELIAEFLSEGIYVGNADRNRTGAGATVSFEFVCEPIDLLEFRNDRLKLRRLSPFGEMLNERHRTGKIAEAAPIQEIIAADLFLFLRSCFTADGQSSRYRWIPHSTVYMRGMPKFIAQSRGSKYAMRLFPALGVDSIPAFREKFAQALNYLWQIFERRGGMLDIYHDFDAADIGSDKLKR